MNEKKGRLVPRRKPRLNPDIIYCYLERLHMDKPDLLDDMIDERSRKNGKPGPSESTLDRALRNREASRRVYALMLTVLQDRLLAAYDKGLTRAEVPMLVHLNRWPNKKIRDEYYAALKDA